MSVRGFGGSKKGRSSKCKIIPLFSVKSINSIRFRLASPLNYSRYQWPIQIRLQEVRTYELVNASQSGLESFYRYAHQIQAPQCSHRNAYQLKFSPKTEPQGFEKAKTFPFLKFQINCSLSWWHRKIIIPMRCTNKFKFIACDLHLVISHQVWQEDNKSFIKPSALRFARPRLQQYDSETIEQLMIIQILWFEKWLAEYKAARPTTRYRICKAIHRLVFGVREMINRSTADFPCRYPSMTRLDDNKNKNK